MSEGKQTAGTVKSLSTYLDKIIPQLDRVLPKHMSSERMARLLLTAFSTTPALRECTFKSLAASLMTAGHLGLEPGVNGAGFLVPYKTTCNFVPGWKGLVDLVSRSGRGTVYTGVIYSDQKYTFTDGARRDLVVHNESSLDDFSEATHVYAIGWVKDSAMPIIDLWSTAKVFKHRDRYNKVGQKHYSYKNPEMYARKEPLLQILKYMPSSVELSNAISLTHLVDNGSAASIIEGVVVPDAPDDEPQKQEPRTIATMTDDLFNAKKSGWRATIEGGMSPQDLIATIGSKHVLSENQKNEIHSWSVGNDG